MNLPAKVWPLIAKAATDPDLRDAAISYMPSAGELFSRDKCARSGVRVSDAGRCVRELWSDIHGLQDLPADPITQVSRFDIGTLYGAWFAALLKATLVVYAPGCTITSELSIDKDGIPGHVDVDVARGAESLWIVEFKSTYWTGPLDPPHKKARYQVHQAGRYALRRGAPAFTVFTFGPAVFRGQKMLQQDYVTDEWRIEVEAEYARLARAADPDEPQPDVKADEKFRCAGCRYSGCDRNTNSILESLKALDIPALSTVGEAK